MAPRRPSIPVPLCEPATKPTRPVRIALLGSTGSIGRQTLDVVAERPDELRVVALAAGSNAELLREQARTFQPSLLAIESGTVDLPGFNTPVVVGPEGLIAAATHPDADIVVIATAGHDAIIPTAKAIEAGKVIALANKETIVCAGELIVPLAREHGAQIRPVDSEHSAIWQALGRSDGRDIRRLILTASGGPFRTLSLGEMARVTVEQALSHPRWVMGDKITIDSATLMNKGLELIEARWLFNVDYGRIDVLVHPQSVVHSLVEFVDGSQVAQLGLPDMRLPIRYALTFPRRLETEGERLDLAALGTLRFEPPDIERFPALRLARDAGTAGRTYPTVLSAADEIAVQCFKEGRIHFVDIAAIVAATLDAHQPWHLDGFEAVFAADDWARRKAEEIAGHHLR